MPTSHVQAQDPSMSPTYAMSTNIGQTQSSNVSSIRRNLFAGHLSRRPVAPSSQNSFGPPSPQRQDSDSQPELSSIPNLQPTKRSMAFQDIFDPTVSPSNHPLSPSTSSITFPRDSIVAVHPITGRPLLPDLPTLPPRLRLSDEDGADTGSDLDHPQDQHMDYQRHKFPRSPSYHNNLNLSSDLGFDPDMDSSELERLGIHNLHTSSHNLGLDCMIDANSEESHHDRERIERLLADMQARQRARAKTIIPPHQDPHRHPTSSSSASHQSSRSKRPTTSSKNHQDRRKGTGNNGPANHVDSATAPSLGGIGASMDPSEKDELMGLIMTSLRRKLQAAEDENWMYGNGGGMSGNGDLDGTGMDHEGGTGWD